MHLYVPLCLPLYRDPYAPFAHTYLHSCELLQPTPLTQGTPRPNPTPPVPSIAPTHSHQSVLCCRLADIASHSSASLQIPHSFDSQQQQQQEQQQQQQEQKQQQQQQQEQQQQPKQKQQQVMPELSGAALMAEALGRLCHAASSTAKRSRSGSPRGSTHTGTAAGPRPAAASTAQASRSGSPGSSSSTHTGIATGAHHAGSSIAKAAGPGPPGHDSTCSNTGTASDARSHAAAHAPVKDTHTAEVVASSGQNAQAGLPVAAVGNAAQLSTEFKSAERSQAVLDGLHAESAAEDERLQCKGEGQEWHSSAEGDGLRSSTEEERLQGSNEDERLQGSTEEERLQGGTAEERLQGSAEGGQTQGSATGAEGGAVGGTVGILAALHKLDAQPDGPQPPADTQAVSGMQSGPAPIPEVSSTQHQSSSGSWGLSEGGLPSVHSSTQEPVAATDVATEAEEQAEPERSEASGSLSAASAGNAVDPPLLITQVG